MPLQPIHYRLHLYGDLHVGSGVGVPGVLDELVVRDQDGFAVIPGSEIKGLVRDNCVRLLDHLGQWDRLCEGQKSWVAMERLMKGLNPEELCGIRGDLPCILCALFGSPATPAGWWFSEATYAGDYRQAIEDVDPALAFRDTATSAHASVHPDTKRADEDHLFSLETVRVPERQTWIGRIEPIPSPHAPQPAVAETELLGWLTAALLFTRRLGGRRRRGWGRGRFVIPKEGEGNLAAVAAVETLLSKKEASDGVS